MIGVIERAPLDPKRPIAPRGRFGWVRDAAIAELPCSGRNVTVDSRPAPTRLAPKPDPDARAAPTTPASARLCAAACAASAPPAPASASDRA